MGINMALHRRCLLYLLVLLTFFALSCKPRKKVESTIKAASPGDPDTATFVKIGSIYDDLTLRHNTFQMRNVRSDSQCLVAGPQRWIPCDGLAHWVIDGFQRQNDRVLYKVRFAGLKDPLCIKKVFPHLQMGSCSEANVAFERARNGYRIVSINDQNSDQVNLEVAIYTSISRVYSVDVAKANEWEKKPNRRKFTHESYQDYFKYIDSILTRDFYPISFSDLSSFSYDTIYKEEQREDTVDRNVATEDQCHRLCGQIGLFCKEFSAKDHLVNRKKVTSKCYEGSRYFTSGMHAEKILLPEYFEFFYKKNLEQGKEKLARIVTYHKTTGSGSEKRVFGCAENLCPDSDLVAIRVPESGSLDTESNSISSVRVYEGENGYVGSIDLYFPKRKSGSRVIKINSKGAKNLSGDLEINPLDSRRFFTTAQFELLQVFHYDYTLNRDKVMQLVSGSPQKSELEYAFGHDKKAFEDLLHQEWGAFMGGLFGFDSLTGIKSLGIIYYDSTGDYVKRASASANDSINESGIAHTQIYKNTSETFGQDENITNKWPHRTIRRLDTFNASRSNIQSTIREIEVHMGQSKFLFTEAEEDRPLIGQINSAPYIRQMRFKIELDTNNNSERNWDLFPVDTGVYTPHLEPQVLSLEKDARFFLCAVSYVPWPKIKGHHRARQGLLDTPNTGGIYALKLTFAKFSGNGFDRNSEETFVFPQNFKNLDRTGKMWGHVEDTSFRPIFPVDATSHGCKRDNKTYVTGFFGKAGDRMQEDGLEVPPAILQLGFYYHKEFN